MRAPDGHTDDRAFSDHRIKLYKELGKLSRLERDAPPLAEVVEDKLRRFRAARAARMAEGR